MSRLIEVQHLSIQGGCVFFSILYINDTININQIYWNAHTTLQHFGVPHRDTPALLKHLVFVVLAICISYGNIISSKY